MLAGQAQGAVHYVSKLRQISGKIWKSSMIELCIPGNFMHNCAMNKLPMLEVQSDASGGALTQPDSNPKTDFESWLESPMEVVEQNPKDMMQME